MKLPARWRPLLAALVACALAAAGLATLVDTNGDGRPDEVVVTIPGPAQAQEIQVRDVVQDLSENSALAEHAEHGPTPELADQTKAANDRAVRAGTYDASGAVQGAANGATEITCLTHQHGAARRVSQIGLGTVHTTEGPNVRGPADVLGLCRWFRQQKLSATWIVDDEGITAKVLPLGLTPWTQWKWNPWACSIEFVGYASRPRSGWTMAQLRAGARLMAYCFKQAGIPIRWGKVAGTSMGSAPRIVLTGAISHKELGYNGGSHVDPGQSFPRALFLQLMREAAGERTCGRNDDCRYDLKVLTPGERANARCLLFERRVAARGGGWEKVHPSHNRRAVTCKRGLERRNEELHRLGLSTTHARAARHRVIHQVV